MRNSDFHVRQWTNCISIQHAVAATIAAPCLRAVSAASGTGCMPRRLCLSSKHAQSHSANVEHAMEAIRAQPPSRLVSAEQACAPIRRLGALGQSWCRGWAEQEHLVRMGAVPSITRRPTGWRTHRAGLGGVRGRVRWGGQGIEGLSRLKIGFRLASDV